MILFLESLQLIYLSPCPPYLMTPSIHLTCTNTDFHQIWTNVWPWVLFIRRFDLPIIMVCCLSWYRNMSPGSCSEWAHIKMFLGKVYTHTHTHIRKSPSVKGIRRLLSRKITVLFSCVHVCNDFMNPTVSGHVVGLTVCLLALCHTSTVRVWASRPAEAPLSVGPPRVCWLMWRSKARCWAIALLLPQI